MNDIHERELQILGIAIDRVLTPKPFDGPWASVHIRVGQVESDIEVELHMRHTVRYPHSREQPGESGADVLEGVKHNGTWITDMFSERQLEELERGAND